MNRHVTHVTERLTTAPMWAHERTSVQTIPVHAAETGEPFVIERLPLTEAFTDG